MKDPERYLTELEVGVQCAVDSRRAAKLDADHRAYVNWEVFFFSDIHRKEKFLKNPVKYCGIITDPITKQRFIPGRKSPRIDHGGTSFYFVSDSTMTAFEAAPDSFSVPDLRMRS